MRTISQPREWQVTCENQNCMAVLAYCDEDVSYNKFLLLYHITCPHCEKAMEVPGDIERRKSLESQGEGQ